MTPGRGTVMFATTWHENLGLWFATRAESEIDTKRGTRKELAKAHGAGFLGKACTRGPVITLWVL